MLWAQFFRFEEDVDEVIMGRKRGRPPNDDDGGIIKRIVPSDPPVKQHWSGRALLQEARKLCRDPELQWRCAEQEQAVCAVVSKAMEVLVVMATGMGKTLLFQLSCSLPGARTTALIVPLVALTLDLLRRCHELGIDCQDWAKNRHSRASLVIMSAEAAASEAGRAYLYELHHAGQLERIVFDECHLICTASVYRRAMAQQALLRSIPVQFVYLTATLPLRLRDELCHRHYLSQVTEIRAPTRRTNITYRVHRLAHKDTDIVQATAAYLQAWWTCSFPDGHGQARAIVFARTKHESDRLGALLSCSSYHADSGDAESKAHILADWMSARSSNAFLVGTSGLGAGLDYPHVRLVLHMDEPYGLIDFVQESGRAGRDRTDAESIVVLRTEWRPRSEGIVEDDERRLHLYVSSTTCRRIHLDAYMDGRGDVPACGPGEASCDRCRSPQGTVAATPSVQHAPVDREPAGLTIMLERERDNTKTFETYEARLTAFRGQCIMCRLRGLRRWADHDFSGCRESQKWEFIHAKREVLDLTRHKWIGKYDACFRCFQPRQSCNPLKGKSCLDKDLVMQSVFTGFQEERYRDALESKFAISFATTSDCLRWAGGTSEFAGVRCVHGVSVLAAILEILEAD